MFESISSDDVELVVKLTSFDYYALPFYQNLGFCSLIAFS